MGCDIGFIESDVGVILLIDVKVFNKALSQEVVKCNTSFFEVLKSKDQNSSANPGVS